MANQPLVDLFAPELPHPHPIAMAEGLRNWCRENGIDPDDPAALQRAADAMDQEDDELEDDVDDQCSSCDGDGVVTCQDCGGTGSLDGGDDDPNNSTTDETEDDETVESGCRWYINAAGNRCYGRPPAGVRLIESGRKHRRSGLIQL